MRRSFLQSKQSVLDHRPLVVGTLTAKASIASQLRVAQSTGIDIVELRLDGFSKAYGAFQKAYEFGRAVIRQIKAKKFPVLLTFRSADEQGSHPKTAIDDKRRAEILARLLPSVGMVDVEIRRKDFAKRMTVVAHIHGVDVIHSAHDFRGLGRFATWNKWSEHSRALKGDVFKVAVTPTTNDDLETFLNWGLGLKNPRKVLIGMGAVGKISRVVAYSFGSILTYGHLGKSAAPGQMSAGDLVRSVRDVYRS